MYSSFIFIHLHDLSSLRSSWHHELISTLTVKSHRLTVFVFLGCSVSPSSVLSPVHSPAHPSQQSCQQGVFVCVCACACVCVCEFVLMKLTNPLSLLHPLQTRPDKQMKYACSAICFIFSWQWPSAGKYPEKYTFKLTSLQYVAYSMLLHAFHIVQCIIRGLASLQGHAVFTCYGANIWLF